LNNLGAASNVPIVVVLNFPEYNSSKQIGKYLQAFKLILGINKYAI